MSRKFSSEMDEFVQGLALEIVQGFFYFLQKFTQEFILGFLPGGKYGNLRNKVCFSSNVKAVLKCGEI